MAGNTGTQVTTTTDSSAVTVDNTPPSAPAITTPNQTINATSIDITGGGVPAQFIVSIYSGATFINS